MPHNPTSCARRFGRCVLAPARAVRWRIAARLDATDTAARAHGWTVEARRFGGRTYRDPRFDRLANPGAAATTDTDRQEALR